MEDIFKKLKTDFEYITGFIYKGLVQALGAGFASRLKEFDDKLEFIKKNAFIATADKDYLYLGASEILPPKPAEIAQGVVVFYGENGNVIPANSEIKDDDGTFKVIADATIAETILSGVVAVADGIATLTVENQLTNTTGTVNGITKKITVVDDNTLQFEAGTIANGENVQVKVNNAIANVIANEAGADYNRVLNDVLKLKITIAGVNTELGVLQIAGGIDDENVEAYRKRVIQFFANPQAPFSKPNIIAENLERLSTLKYVWVKGGEIIDGTVQVFAINNDYGLTAYEIEQITNNTKAIAPANLDTTAITVTSAIVQNVDIVIEGLTPSSDGLKTEVEKNIKYFFSGDMYEKTITQANLEAIIYRTTNGAESVESFTLISGWQSATDNTFWKLNNVIFQ